MVIRGGRGQCRLMGRPGAVWATLAVVWILVGCGSPVERAEKHFQRGNLYLQAEKYAQAIGEFHKCVELDAGRLDARLKLAAIYQRRNNPDLAIEELKKVLAVEPAHEGAQRLRAQILLSIERYDAALEACADMIAARPDSVEGNIMKARVLARMNENPRAIEQLTTALRKEPASIAARIQLGRVYLRMNRLDLAEREARKVLSDYDAESLDANLLLSEIAERRGNLQEAVKAVEKVLATEPNRVESVFRLGILHYRMALEAKRQRDLEGAEAHLTEALKLSGKIAEVNPRHKALQQYLRGKVLVQQERYSEAISDLQDLAAAGAQDPSVYIDLARAQLAVGNPQMALQQLRSVLTFDAENIPARIMMGVVYLHDKKYDSAIDSAKDVLRSHPDSIAARHLLSSAYLAGGRYEEASGQLSEVARLSPNSPMGLISQALLALSQGQFAEAEQLAERIIDEAPEEATGYNLLGVAQLEQQNWQGAVENFRRALELRLDFLAPRKNLVRLYLRIRRPDLAAREYRAALEISPNEIDLRLALAQLYFRGGERSWDLALEQYAAVLERLPDQKEALLGQARINAGRRQFDTVEQLCRRVLDLDANDLSALLLLGETHHRQGRYDDALRVYRMISTVRPDHPGGHLGKMLCELFAQDLKAADETAANARNLIPDQTVLKLDHAIVLHLRGRFREAIALAEESIHLQGEEERNQAVLANIQLSAGNANKAFELLDTDENRLMGVDAVYRQFAAAIQATGRSEWPAQVNQVLLFLRQRWTTEAEQLASQLIEQDDQVALFYAVRGQVLMAQGSFAEAKACYQKILALEPDYLAAHRYLSNIALSFEKDYPLARNEILTLLEKTPDPHHAFFLPLYVTLGRIYDLMGDRGEAIKTYRKVLEIDPDDFKALNNLAYLYVERNQNDEALSYAERAYVLQPYSGAVVDTLGWIYYRQGRFEDALERLRLAAALLPFEPTVHFHLGKALIENTQERLALGALQRALMLSEDFPERAETEQLASGLRERVGALEEAVSPAAGPE